MKEVLLQLARYHLWANQTLMAAIEALPAEQQLTEVKSSFRSLQGTLLHMWDAESIWWQRMKLQERIVIPSETFSGTFAHVKSNLLDLNTEWLNWLQQAQDHMLLHEFIYYNLKKEKFKQPVFQVLMHLFNHGTYHRGQLVNMLRQLGVSKIPPTDFIVWSRKKL